MDALETIREPIEGDIARYRALFVAAFGHDNPLLDRALTHLAQRPGKMMRPILGLLAARLYGEATESVLHAMVALELLHTASLVHDDVLDESDQRRGQASVNALMHNTEAVLVGDFLLSRALEHASLTGRVEVVEAIARLGQTLADGELLQLFNTTITTIDEVSYFRVIERKTASLFATCAHVGALLAGATEEEVSRMREVGRRIGLCFQIRDDIFDYLPTRALGKPTGVDMREGKLTLPVIYAVTRPGRETFFDMALRVRSGQANADDIATLTRLAIDEGGIDYARQAMHRLAHEAEQLLAPLPHSDLRQALTRYIRYVAEREK